MSAVTRAASALTIRASAKAAKTTTTKAKATKAVAPKASIPARAAGFARDCTKPATLAVIANIVAAAPAHAEAGKLFDFNLTLPLIATEFLILMTILDKTMFGPVGKALDDRDELIRSQLAAVGDNSAEVENLIVRYFLRVLIRRWRLARDRSRVARVNDRRCHHRGYLGFVYPLDVGAATRKELTD